MVTLAKEVYSAATNELAPVATAPTRGRLLRLLLGFPGWVRANPLRGSIVIAAMAIIGVGAGLTLAFRVASRPSYIRQLGQAFAKLDAEEWGEARRLAAELLAASDAGYQDEGGAFYILGAVTLHEADQQINANKRKVLDLIASRYLEEARNRRVPQTRERDGLLMLGRALHDAGRFASAVPVLREALQADPAGNHQLHAL